MRAHEKINYVELPAAELRAVKAFFTEVFGWAFVDYGADYTAFTGGGLDGGFYRANTASVQAGGAALVVFYSNDLAQTQAKIETAGGRVVKPVFAFPGGRRFHFTDPAGNEWAVWSDA